MRYLAEYQRKAFAILHQRFGIVIDVRPEELPAALYGFAYFFCLLSSYYLLRPLRDAMGLTGGVHHLQWLFTATFLSMLVLVPVFGLLAARWPPRRFVPFIYRFFALNILGFGALFTMHYHEIAVSRIFFVWISVFNLFVVSIFWSVLADHFNSEQGRRLFGFIAAGGTAGALVGPALAAALVVKLGALLLTVLAAIFLELAVQCFQQLAHATAHQSHAVEAASAEHSEPNTLRPRYDTGLGGGVLAGISLILRDRYLIGIVLYMLLHTFASTFLYFEQGRIVATELADTASRTRLFAIADLATSCITIALQVFITGRLMRRRGVAAALILLPVVGLLAFIGIAIWPTLAVVVAAQSIRRAIDYAIARPGREVLFTIVSREAKYKAKSVIETVVYRGGDALSGWLFSGLAAIGIGFSGVALISVPMAAVWIWLAAWLAHRQDRRAKQLGLQAASTRTTASQEV